MTRVPVKPEIVRWARERANMSQAKLAKKFRKLPEWENGETRPTLNQVEDFARTVHVPIGFLFLSEPPEEKVPIPDFRCFADKAVTRPSPNLLDMIYACQERQSWFREFVRANGQPELPFVGSASVEASPETVSAEIRETLSFDLAAQQSCNNWTDALRLFARRADDVGVLVMASGIVLSNTHRPLDPTEFRGFALCDPLAPLIFVNGKDTKAAQMLTLAHELAHIWLGASGLSNLGGVPRSGFQFKEVWCNAVAAEVLVPLDALQSELRRNEPLPGAMSRLARQFNVSKLVILRRLLDANWISREKFDTEWTQEIDRLQTLVQQQPPGGNFYNTTF